MLKYAMIDKKGLKAMLLILKLRMNIILLKKTFGSRICMEIACGNLF